MATDTTPLKRARSGAGRKPSFQPDLSSLEGIQRTNVWLIKQFFAGRLSARSLSEFNRTVRNALEALKLAERLAPREKPSESRDEPDVSWLNDAPPQVRKAILDWLNEKRRRATRENGTQTDRSL